MIRKFQNTDIDQIAEIKALLLEYVKERKTNLSLRVYKKNVGAV